MSEIIVLHGAPGSGKTTHAERLTKLHPNVAHVSVGNQLRSILLGKTESQYKQAIDAHAEKLAVSAPIDHEVVNGVIFEFIKECPAAATVIIDGYPRFIEQIPNFIKSVELGDHLLIGLILLNVSENTSLSRIMDRGARDGERNVDQDFARWRFNEHQEKVLPTSATLRAVAQLIEIDAELAEGEVWNNFYDAVYGLRFDR